MKQTKIGAILIGMMFLLSLIAAVPVNATVGDHKIVIGSVDSNFADTIKVFEGSTQVGERATVSGSAYFYLAHGSYNAEVYQAGVKKADVSFPVNDTSPSIITYNINGVAIPAKPVLSVATSGTSANLLWTYSGPAIDGFNITRDGTQITSVAKDATTYTDTGLTPATTYAYSVSAYNVAGSTASDAVSITTAQNATQTGDILIYDLNYDDSDVAPGSVQTFELELKNNATYDAEDVVATIIIHSIGAGKDDLKTDIDYGTISSGDRQTESVDITIPQDADDKLYTISVDLAWKDADGNHYTGTFTSADQMEVVKVKHQISITSLQLDEAKYLPGSTVQLAVNLMDTGANAETVTLKASSDIGASATSASFKMKEGDSTMQYLSFNVPENTKAGKYYVVVTASYGSTYATKSIVIEIASTEAPTTVAVVTPTDKTNGGAGIPATSIALAVIIILLIGAIGWMAKDLIVAPKAKPIAARSSKVFK